jgi:hypothetical protein
MITHEGTFRIRSGSELGKAEGAVGVGVVDGVDDLGALGPAEVETNALSDHSPSFRGALAVAEVRTKV